jgi:hypothetical protein
MRTFIALAFCFLLASPQAHACMMIARLEPGDIKYADVVVVGRITDYEVVLDPEIRRQQKEAVAPNRRFLSDYARFRILVDEVLVGKPPKILFATWDNSTFGEPSRMEEGPFLIGLRDPHSKSPPLRGPSATIMPNQEPQTLTVLQAPCAGPFIFEATGDMAKAIREILAGAAK